MKILGLAMLLSLVSPRLWVSLDQKYLYQLNEYMAQKVKAKMEGTTLGNYYQNWKEETTIGTIQRHMGTNNMIIQNVSMLNNDLRIHQGSMLSRGQANYTCQTQYNYYDHLDRANGTMLVNTDMIQQVIIAGSCELNISTKVQRLTSRISLQQPAVFLENELDRLYRAVIRHQVQQQVNKTVANTLKNAFLNKTLLKFQYSQELLYYIQGQKMDYHKGRLVVIADDRLYWGNISGEAQGRGLPRSKWGKDMTIGWDERSINRYTDIQYQKGGLNDLVEPSRLVSNMTVQQRPIGCTVRLLDLIFPGLKRHFRFQEQCYWTKRLAKPLVSTFTNKGSIKTKVISQVTAVVGQQVGVDLLVTIEYTFIPYLENDSLRLNTTSYQLTNYQMLPTSRVQCQGAQSPTERYVYCSQEYSYSQSRLWQMILLNYAQQMKSVFNGQQIPISPLLNNQYYQFSKDVSVVVRSQAIMLQGTLLKISLPSLLESLEPNDKIGWTQPQDEQECPQA